MANLRLVVSNPPPSHEGEIARDEAIAQVLAAASPAWKRAMRDLIYNLPEGWEGIFEQIRFMAEGEGYPAHHKNAWGSITRIWIDKGALRHKSPIVEEKMTDPINHARKSKILVRTGWI
jgi:hypothetical protein